MSAIHNPLRFILRPESGLPTHVPEAAIQKNRRHHKRMSAPPSLGLRPTESDESPPQSPSPHRIHRGDQLLSTSPACSSYLLCRFRDFDARIRRSADPVFGSAVLRLVSSL